jgi:type IX secretion system PorP/SprF family membrane protein
MMKKIFLLFFVLYLTININVIAQQLHDFTQFPSVLFHINPAYTGTKGTLDARLSYRKQWTGFSGAPTTQFVGMHGRFWKGRIGVGSSLYKDELGPIQMFDYGFTAAYHIHFPDVEFSAGIGIRFNKLTMNSSGMTTHWEGDPAVTPGVTAFAKSKNALAGMMLYNDRFHFGLGVMNIISNQVALGGIGATIKNKQHYFLNFGYNFHGHPYYVWENNLMAEYVDGLPLTINYNLRLHYREKLSVGAGWRLKDAVYLQAGWVLFRSVQIAYSYDFGISKLRKGHNGTHEITLAYRYDYEKKKGKYNNFNTFQRQRYNIF